MLLALVNNQSGLRRATAIALLSLSMLLAFGLFGAQIASPRSFGCTFFAEDFAALYTTGELLLKGDGSAAYDQVRRREAGVRIMEASGSRCGPIAPASYWLVFLLPVLPFALLAPVPAYYLWTALSCALFFVSLWRLSRALQVRAWPFWIVGFGFFPFTIGLLQGQIHVWMFTALIELWLALKRNRERSAGLWLSLLVVKPDYLLVPLLYLVWLRRWNVMRWFLGAGLLLATVSVFLAGGLDSIGNYARLYWSYYAPVAAHASVMQMVNWRGFAFNWFGEAGAAVMLALIVVLILATTALVIWFLQTEPKVARSFEGRLFLVLTAAALLNGYYVLPYSATLIVAPALWLLVDLKDNTGRLAILWSVLLDFTLLGPGLIRVLTIFFPPSDLTLWVLPNQALLFALVAALFGGVLARMPTRQHQRELAATEQVGFG